MSTARRMGRAAVRGAGMATAPLRDMPDFVLIGAKRCGTTSLYRVLEQHPGMMPLFPPSEHLPMKENIKGVHWFDRDATRSQTWYRSHFATAPARRRRQRRIGGPVVTGEASPYYMFHPTGAEQAAERLGDARFIVMLRNPIDRTYSSWKEQVRNGRESLSFPEALDAEESRLAGEAERVRADPSYYSYAHENHSYVAQSMYGHVLAPWLERFPTERFLVLRSEDFYADPSTALSQVEDFLGLDHHTYADLSARNAAAGEDLEPEMREKLWARLSDDVDLLESQFGRGFDWGP